MRRRWSATGAIAGLLVLAVPGTATADVTTGTCTGTATIAGNEYTPANDSPSNPIVVPDEEGLVAAWTASIADDPSNLEGKIQIVIAGLGITVADWGTGPNAEREANGDYSIDEARAEIEDVVPVGVIPGLYRVRGNHGTICEGFAMVRIEGSPLGNVVGWVVVVGIVVSAGGLVTAFRSKPIPIIEKGGN
jgi:hypothetical protein